VQANCTMFSGKFGGDLLPIHSIDHLLSKSDADSTHICVGKPIVTKIT